MSGIDRGGDLGPARVGDVGRDPQPSDAKAEFQTALQDIKEKIGGGFASSFPTLNQCIEDKTKVNRENQRAIQVELATLLADESTISKLSDSEIKGMYKAVCNRATPDGLAGKSLKDRVRQEMRVGLEGLRAVRQEPARREPEPQVLQGRVHVAEGPSVPSHILAALPSVERVEGETSMPQTELQSTLAACGISPDQCTITKPEGHANIDYHVCFADSEVVLAIGKGTTSTQLRAHVADAMASGSALFYLKGEETVVADLKEASGSVYGPVAPPEGWEQIEIGGKKGYQTTIQGMTIRSRTYPTGPKRAGFESQFQNVHKIREADLPILSSATPGKMMTDPHVSFRIRIGDSAYNVQGLGRGEDGQLKGTGAFGRVFVGTEEGTGKKVAIKHVFAEGDREVRFKDIKGEPRLMLDLHQAGGHLVGASQVGHIGKRMFIVMDAMEGGDLHDRIVASHGVANIKYVRDAAKGVAAMHREGVLHLDIKPDNILIGEGGRAAVGDFGISTRLAKGKTEASKVCGTPGFIAPEVLSSGKAQKASDVFSLGMTLYSALTGRRPRFQQGPKGEGGVISWQADIGKIRFGEIRARHGEEVAQLLRDCLSLDPKDRPTAEVLSHKLDRILASR